MTGVAADADRPVCVSCGEPAESGHVEAGWSIVWYPDTTDSSSRSSSGLRRWFRWYTAGEVARRAERRSLGTSFTVPRVPARRCTSCRLVWLRDYAEDVVVHDANYWPRLD
jgi:hypothetical protein